MTAGQAAALQPTSAPAPTSVVTQGNFATADSHATGLPAPAPTSVVPHGNRLKTWVIGTGLLFLLMSPWIFQGASTPVERPEEDDTPSPQPAAAVPGSPVRPAAGWSRQEKAEADAKKQEQALKEQALKEQEIARKRRQRTIAEYTALAEILSHGYHHNEKLIEERWKRVVQPSMGPVLGTARFDDELPRVRTLLRSENTYVRGISIAIIQDYIDIRIIALTSSRRRQP